MVPIKSNTPNIMLRDVYRLLLEQVKAVDTESVEGAFVSWMNDHTLVPSSCGLPDDFTVTNYHHVSRLAFLMEINHADQQNHVDLLKDGLNRVAGRPITLLATEPAPFRHDAVALLGLALGARRVGGDVQAKVAQWMRSFVRPSDKEIFAWKQIFYLATLALIGETVDQRDLQNLSDCADIKLAFAAKGLDIFGDIDLNLAYQSSSYNTIVEEADIAISACRLTALNYLSNKVPVVSMTKPTIVQVINLLERLAAGLKRWPWEDKSRTTTSTAQRWDIQNEYHVQALAYSSLACVFSDIEDEFYLDPIGQLNPRADIGLPSLNLIIEIKFLRHNVSFARMTEEIAADASLYFRNESVFTKKYSQMIVLLWDNSSRNQHHYEFKTGISKINNVVGAVVVSRPGNMMTGAVPVKKVKAKSAQAKKRIND